MRLNWEQIEKWHKAAIEKICPKTFGSSQMNVIGKFW